MTPIPPLFNLNKICKSYSSTQLVTHFFDSTAQQICNCLKYEFNPSVEMYTFGSKIIAPDTSCSAAVIIKTNSNTVMNNYRLLPETEIMGCELFCH